tara:strand:- start:1278 stop:1394 length:117 start_codon:yes stop_codon:yes gene_type:complete
MKTKKPFEPFALLVLMLGIEKGNLSGGSNESDAVDNCF